eukprot:2367330-Amphidinium_carterae.1
MLDCVCVKEDSSNEDDGDAADADEWGISDDENTDDDDDDEEAEAHVGDSGLGADELGQLTCVMCKSTPEKDAICV